MEEMGGYLVAHAVAGGTTTCQSPLLSLASASTLEKGTAAGGWDEAGPPRPLAQAARVSCSTCNT